MSKTLVTLRSYLPVRAVSGVLATAVAGSQAERVWAGGLGNLTDRPRLVG